MAKSNSKAKKTILKLLRHTFSDLIKCEEIDVKEAYRLPESKVKVSLKEHPFQINLYPDGKALHLYPEENLDSSSGGSSGSYLLLDPDTYFTEVSGFYRLEDEDKITLGGNDNEQRAFLHISKDNPRRKLSISNNDGALVFKSHVENPKSCISPLLKEKKVSRVIDWRRKKLQRLRKLFDGEIRQLPGDEALSLLQKVNQIMENEVYRAKDKSGKPGGIVELPDDATVFILGDLHTKTDNLLTVLTQNGFLEALEDKRACFVILGDAVHSEEPGSYDEMDSSILIMDVILQLKAAFPEQVFYLRGNHDSFSQEIAKGGVPQGLMWEKSLVKSRGKTYRKEMERLYDLLPYVVYSRSFIACHASPPTSAASKEMLINIRSHPKLARDIINTRVMRPGRPSGYTKGDVKRFRKLMHVSENTPVIVGHTPLSMDETLWEKAGEIENHYVAYGSDKEWVGVMTQIGDQFYPLRYRVEPITSLINSEDPE